MREKDMLELLQHRYTKVRQGTTADRFVRAAHVRAPGSYGYSPRIADYIVMDTYGSGTIIGHEVKVSRSDWLKELREPDKSTAWKQYCHQWYLVINDISYVKDGELPLGWGIMTINKTGQMRVRKKAPIQEPLPLTTQAVGLLTRSVALTREKELLVEKNRLFR